jgi:hypothetical protein
MASRILSGKLKKKRKPQRSTEEYLASAKRLSGLVPKLKKYKRRKTLTRYEKSAIGRRERQLKNIPWLFPVTNKQAKKKNIRRKFFLPGIQAIQLRGLPPGTQIKIGPNGDIEVLAAGNRRWLYWSLDRETVRSKHGMRKAGADAFSKMFPIEKISDMAAEAFARADVQQVNLWAHAGIVGDGFQDLPSFIRWVNEKWNAGRYMGEQDRTSGAIYSNPSDPGKWVNGIAILLEDKEYTAARKKAAGHIPYSQDPRNPDYKPK